MMHTNDFLWISLEAPNKRHILVRNLGICDLKSLTKHWFGFTKFLDWITTFGLYFLLSNHQVILEMSSLYLRNVLCPGLSINSLKQGQNEGFIAPGCFSGTLQLLESTCSHRRPIPDITTWVQCFSILQQHTSNEARRVYPRVVGLYEGYHSGQQRI